MATALKLARYFRSDPLPRTSDLIVTMMEIFLYRDKRARPREAFYLIQEKTFPRGPWRMETYPMPGPGTFFSVFTDQPSLQEAHPLRFLAFGCALTLETDEPLALFQKRGGGLGASPKADLAALRSLFDSLRAFPQDWRRQPAFRVVKRGSDVQARCTR